MTAASHPKDDVWAQGTVLGAVKLLVRTLGTISFYSSRFFIASLIVLFDMLKYEPFFLCLYILHIPF